MMMGSPPRHANELICKGGPRYSAKYEVIDEPRVWIDAAAESVT
jgi:hypothetical protein